MKSARRRSRELALQGLYAWQLAAMTPRACNPARGVQRLRQGRCRVFLATPAGTIAHAEALERLIAPVLDRKLNELSPVERGILLLAAFELQNAPDIPYKVVINEAIELAKDFGGTDGHKYVNGVLDKLVSELRPQERKA